MTADKPENIGATADTQTEEKELRTSKLSAEQQAAVRIQSTKRSDKIRQISPDSFNPAAHFYPRVLNATVHPMVASFMNLSNKQIVKRYTHLNPKTDKQALTEALAYIPKYLRWAGADLFHVTNENGKREMLVVETNSCPSGQKSMPLVNENEEYGGYKVMMEHAFVPMLEKKRIEDPDSYVEGGCLAVIYDKNLMEASGYASAMATVFDEKVYLVEIRDQFGLEADISDEKLNEIRSCKWVDGVCYVRAGRVVVPKGKASADAEPAATVAKVDEEKPEWVACRAVFRYVTSRPWNRIPIKARTVILNPVIVCLAGGRNKTVAAKAYDLYNAELRPNGFNITVPETIRDVAFEDVPTWVQSFGGRAVVKNPYSNAGQGVYTITNQGELNDFMAMDHPYGQFIVQQLVGNTEWSSICPGRSFYHVGTMPKKDCKTFVFDLRVMVCGTEKGFRPVAMYARTAANELADKLDEDTNSWGILGTNLSVRSTDGTWDSETERLLLLDRKDFNRLGIGSDDLIEAYIQTVLATTAIDKMCARMMEEDGALNLSMFRTVNNDDALVAEIMEGNPGQW
ncbi:hypothetical protein SARC_03809 [Sphaeroforma arctica JP610]|uniref:Uncharacterized protein n=1 Tax=Sphaeroforma arctica JP610 TaxID=667725 RepID=A0A0L0G4G4_9EUKA|nr:hypothetical protein SARC_03809 [Sphaeroforma arctica JP610]KNC83945.1 hypothetical protein SARC_03809 [Sphaeroforma arctica JP610]|eukprot:XP_014157847.1 hypothetical protein SARC_03809 [Sphaeroforma arctica JP610]